MKIKLKSEEYLNRINHSISFLGKCKGRAEIEIENYLSTESIEEKMLVELDRAALHEKIIKFEMCMNSTSHNYLSFNKFKVNPIERSCLVDAYVNSGICDDLQAADRRARQFIEEVERSLVEKQQCMRR